MFEDTSIPTLTSHIDKLTLDLEGLRKGPDMTSEHARSPVMEYPGVPPQPVGRGDTEELCYVLGWLEADVSMQMMEMAGYRVKRKGEETYEETYARALKYMGQTANYFHLWSTNEFVPGEDASGPDVVVGPPLLAICCSLPRAYHRRPNKGQFEWFKKVVGMEPRWYLSTEAFYKIEESCGLWRPNECCPLIKGGAKCHFVDLKAGEWVHDRGRKDE